MQRRTFLRKAACVGVSASVFIPVCEALAMDAAPMGDVSMSFERLSAVAVSGSATFLQLRVAPRQLAVSDQAVRVRAWFATDAATTAFDLASFGRQGASQRLRFTVDARRLIGFELGHGQGFDDCKVLDACRATSADGAILGPGVYRVSLIRGGRTFAEVDFDVSAAVA